MSRVCLSLLAIAVAALGATPAFAAKPSPACSAINFRPVTGSPNDGVMDAGLYHLRSGDLVLKAEIKGGQAVNYYITLGGKRPEALKGPLPAAVNPCLNSKHVVTPPPPAGASCTGERFRVALDKVGKADYVMLFGLQGDAWHLCSAAQQ